MKNAKKIAAIGLVGLMGAGLLAGCTQKFTQEEVNEKIKAAEMSKQAELQNQYSAGLKDTVDSAVADAVKQATKDKDNEVAKMVQEELDRINSEKEVEASANVEPTYEFKVIDDLGLNVNIPADTLTKSDLPKFIDDSIEFDGEDYDVRETFEIKANSVQVGTNLIYDEEFKSEPYMVFTAEDALVYNFVFDDPITVADISEDEPLEISFLGKSLKIVDADSNSITFRKGTEVVFNEGDSKVVDNNPEIKLVAITSDRVSVDVNGVTKTIKEGDIETVNGVDIAVDEILYQDYAGGVKVATLFVGKDAQETITDGDDYTEDDETFQYGITVNSGKLEKISVKYHPNGDSLGDTDEPVYKKGEKVVFPNEYVSVEFDYDADYSYADFLIDFDEAGESDTKAFRIKASEDLTLKVGTEELDVAYLNDTKVFYKDTDNDWVETTSPIKIDYKETGYTLSYDANTDYLSIAGIGVKSANFEYLGATEDEAENDEIKYNVTELGNQDYDILLTNGVVVKDPENNGDKDQVKISIPSDTVEAVLKVGYKKE